MSNKDLILNYVHGNPKLETLLNMLIDIFPQTYDSDSLKEYFSLLREISKMNYPIFWGYYYPAIRNFIIKEHPQVNIISIETKLVDELYLLKDLNETIQFHFVGKVKLPELETKIEGHIFFTNLRIIIISWKRKKSTFFKAATTAPGYIKRTPVFNPRRSLIGTLILSAIPKKPDKTTSARNQFAIAIYQQIQIFKHGVYYFQVSFPSNVRRIRDNKIQVLMNLPFGWDYFRLKMIIVIRSNGSELITRILDFFNNFRNRICHNCKSIHVEDLDNCKKCNNTLNVYWRTKEVEKLKDAEQRMKSLSHINKAIANDPKNVDLWIEKAEILTTLGEYKESLIYLDQALKFDPESPIALLKRAQILQLLEKD